MYKVHIALSDKFPKLRLFALLPFALLISAWGGSTAKAATWTGVPTLVDIGNNGGGAGVNGGSCVQLSGGTWTGTHPACATDTAALCFNSATTGGQSFLSAIIAAELAGRSIGFAGGGTCNTISFVEELVQISF